MEQNNLKKNVLWNTLGSVFYCMCQWLITVLVVRLDSFEASGQLSLAMTTSSSFSAVSLFSMRQFQVSDVNGEYSSKEYYGSRIATCIAAQISCMIYAVVVSSSAVSFWCVAFFMLVRVAEAFVDVFHGINQKFDRYDIIGKSFIIRGILTVTSFSVIIAITHNMVLTLGVMACLNLMVAFLYDRVKTGALEDIKPTVCKRVWQLILTCVPLVIFSFLLSLENLIPKNILEAMYGVEDLGIYASIASPTLVVQVVASVVFNPFLPQFTKLYVDGEIESFKKMFYKIIMALAALTVVVMLGAAMVGRFGLSFLFGKEILAHYNLFMPIVLCTILTAAIWVLSAILIAMRQIKALLIGIVADFVLCLLMAEPIIAANGKNGVSIVQIIAYIAFVVFMIIVCEISIKRAGKTARKYN